MTTPIPSLLLLMAGLLVATVAGQSSSAESAAIRDYLGSFDARVAPSRSREDGFEVSLAVKLRKLVAVHMDDGAARLRLATALAWRDVRLVNGSSALPERLTLDATAVWTPTVLLWNAEDTTLSDFFRVSIERGSPPLTVEPRTGTVTWVDISGTTEIHCEEPALGYDQPDVEHGLDATLYPFDINRCGIELRPAIKAQFQLKVGELDPEEGSHVAVDKDTDFGPDDKNINFEVLKTALEIADEEENSLKLVVYFRRRSAYFFNTVIIPVVALSGVMLMTLMSPVDEGSRVDSSVTVLLSLIVFHATFMDEVPRNSTHTPYFVMYVTILISFAGVLSVEQLLLKRFLDKGEKKAVSNPHINKVLKKVYKKNYDKRDELNSKGDDFQPSDSTSAAVIELHNKYVKEMEVKELNHSQWKYAVNIIDRIVFVVAIVVIVIYPIVLFFVMAARSSSLRTYIEALPNVVKR